MTGNILIIDDEEQLRKLLARIVLLEGFSVTEASTLQSAREILRHHQIDVVLCDVRLPDGNGVEFVMELRRGYPTTEIVLLTAYGNISDGVQAMKNGAFDYITKGDDNNRILPLLYQATDKSVFQRKSAIKVRDNASYDFGSIIGKSAAIKFAIDVARKISSSGATVLLLGETGTGKEVFANAIHHNSKRKDNSLVAINCSAFNKELLEGELFGHKAGAYTNAAKDKKGLVEVAEGGTLFLDEIGELQIDLQAKLLRFLENGEFIKLGDTKVSKANVRIIAATNRDLEKDISAGHFREDLYYRLNIFTIQMPPLRERQEDIPLLAHYFLACAAEEEKTPLLTLTKDALNLLQQYPWKGNIRELKNVLARAVVLVDGTQILPQHLPYEIQRQSDKTIPGVSLASVEREHIQKILHHTNGNKAKASRLLEIGLATLYRKMQEYGIS